MERVTYTHTHTLSSRSPRQVAMPRPVEQVFPNTFPTKKETNGHYERFTTRSDSSGFKKEDKSLYEQLKQQRDKDENSDWEETTGSINAPAVLEEEDIEFLEQLKKKKEETFRSLDEQVEKFKERRQNLVLVTAEEQQKAAETEVGGVVQTGYKRKFGRLPSYLKTKEKRTKVESCAIPSNTFHYCQVQLFTDTLLGLIPYSSNESDEQQQDGQ